MPVEQAGLPEGRRGASSSRRACAAYPCIPAALLMAAGCRQAGHGADEPAVCCQTPPLHMAVVCFGPASTPRAAYDPAAAELSTRPSIRHAALHRAQLHTRAAKAPGCLAAAPLSHRAHPARASIPPPPRLHCHAPPHPAAAKPRHAAPLIHPAPLWRGYADSGCSTRRGPIRSQPTKAAGHHKSQTTSAYHPSPQPSPIRSVVAANTTKHTQRGPDKVPSTAQPRHEHTHTATQLTAARSSPDPIAPPRTAPQLHTTPQPTHPKRTLAKAKPRQVRAPPAYSPAEHKPRECSGNGPAKALVLSCIWKRLDGRDWIAPR